MRHHAGQGDAELTFPFSGPKKAPIYFCPVGTVLAFSLKIVPAVDAYAQKRLTLNQ